MERVIKTLEFYNATQNKKLGALAGKDKIMHVANLGLVEATIQWQEDADSETRKVIDSRVNAMTYDVTIFSDTYDSKSAAGDTVFFYLIRSAAGKEYARYCFGVLQAVTRERFSRNNSVMYSTEYKVYCSNPLWAAVARPLSDIEGDNMTTIYTTDITLSNTAPTAITVTPAPTDMNTVRGVRIRMAMNAGAVYSLPFTIRFTCNNLTFDIVYKEITSDEIVLFFGESLVDCNCNRGYVSGRVTPKFTSDILDKYTDYSMMHLQPAQWDNGAFEMSAIAISDTALTAQLHIEIDTIVGDYF